MVSFKEQKEASVTGFEGTSPQELLLIIVGAPIISYWLFCLVATTTTKSTTRSSSSSFTRAILLEAIILWFPLILCQSVFLYPYGIIYLFVQILVSIRMEITRRRRRRRRRRNRRRKIHDENPIGIHNDSRNDYRYVTVYRCMGLYMTFIAILSVDFPNFFPRRFVKTEIHGYSLMDLGASFSVMASGLCSFRARQRKQQQRQQQQHGSTQPLQQQLQPNYSWKKTVLYRMVPLLFMGFLRLIVHGGIEYQEHVSEYGVHWNFFFTLAMVLSIGPRFMSLIFRQEQSSRPSWIIPLVMMIAYQYALEYTYLPLQLSTLLSPSAISDGDSSSSSSSSTAHAQELLLVPLKQWIEDAPRHCISKNHDSSGSISGFIRFITTVQWFFCNFYVANREGLLGCIGYTSLYLTSEWIGHVFVWNKNNNNKFSLWLLGFGLVLLWRFLVSNNNINNSIGLGLGLECSRRSTNAIFICWTLVVNVLVLSGLQTIHDYYYYQHSDTCADENDTTGDDNKTNYNKQSQQQQQGQMIVLVPVVWAAVNRHGLVCFIAANLLTGILNLSIPNMLEISGTTALVIVTVYITSIGLLALLLDQVLTATSRNTTTAHPSQTNSEDDNTNAKAKAE